MEVALKNPKETLIYQIHRENHELAHRISREQAKSEEIRQGIDECEDNLVEYHNMLRFNRENHEKHLSSMKDLSDSYAKIIEKERNALPNTCENQVLKNELCELIGQRNALIHEINNIENEERTNEDKEESDLKQYINYLSDQLKLIINP